MKRIGLTAIAVLGVCALCIAGTVETKVLTVTTHSTNNTFEAWATNTTIRGWIEDVTFDVVTASTTGTLSLVAVPAVSTLANVEIAAVTNCAADVTIRPSWQRTTTTGTAISGAYGRWATAGESWLFMCTNGSATSVTFKCVIKYERPD